MRLLSAAPNFRDLGGLKAAYGRELPSGRVFRSGALDELETEDLVRLKAMGLRLCCDLRTESERLLAPSRWPEGGEPRLLQLELASDIRAHNPDLVEMVRQASGREVAAQVMLGLYRTMPSACAPILARLLPELVEA